MKTSLLTFATLITLMIPNLGFSQESNYTKSEKASAVAAVTGVTSYLKLRKETLFKNSGKLAMAKEEMKSVAQLIKPGDKIVIRQAEEKGRMIYPSSDGWIDKHSSKTLIGPSEETLLKAIEKAETKNYIKSIKRVNNVVTINVIKKAGILEIGLALTSLTSVGYALFHMNDGKNEKASARFNNDGRSNSKDSLQTSTTQTAQHSSSGSRQ